MGEPPDLPGAQVFYATGDVVRILSISRRQLQYWAKTDLVPPSARTPGGHRRYSFEDLVSLKATKRLIDAGVSLQKIRKSIEALRRALPSIRQPLSQLVLVATGDVVLVFREGAVFEAISGQEWVFAVAEFQREVELFTRAEKSQSSKKKSRENSKSREKTDADALLASGNGEQQRGSEELPEAASDESQSKRVERARPARPKQRLRETG